MQETTMIPFSGELLPIDWTIILLYIFGVIGFGLLMSRGRQNAEDYFLASREAKWPMIGLALLASNISSTTLIGLAGAAYALGISVYNYEWMAAVVLVFFCIFFLPFLLRSQVYTLPEWLEKRYGRFARLYFSGLTIFLNVVVDASSTLYGGAIMFHLILPTVPLSWLVVALALLAGLYTIAGGLKAVMYTETIQAILLLTASVIISIAAFHAAGGWDKVMADVPAEKMSLIRPIGDEGVPWPGLLFGVPLLGFYFWCTNQFMVQRVLSAVDENHGRWGCLFAGALKLPVLFIMVLPGSCALLLFPHLEKADTVYPHLLFGLLSHGVIGLVVAGFLAALMSAVASTFNSASTLVTMDFVVSLRKNNPLSSKSLVLVGRLATLCIMGLAILWAPNIEKFNSLWQYLQSILAYTVSPVVALFIVGLFWKKATSKGAVVTIIVGLTLGLWLFYATKISDHPLSIHFLLIAPLIFTICVLIHIGASLLLGQDESMNSDAILKLTWTPDSFRQESEKLRSVPLLKNYRFLSLILILVTTILVYNFR
jgi:SSS family solute:Na+ symporter